MYIYTICSSSSVISGDAVVPALSSTQWHEHGALAAHACAAMLDGFVGDGELGQVMSDHLRLDLNVDVLLAVVHTHDAANHLGHDDHVAQMSFHCLWLLAISCLALGFAQLLQHGDWLALNATAELAALASPEELHEVLVAHVQKLVKINSAIGIFAECPLLGLAFSRPREKLVSQSSREPMQEPEAAPRAPLALRAF